MTSKAFIHFPAIAVCFSLFCNWATFGFPSTPYWNIYGSLIRFIWLQKISTDINHASLTLNQLAVIIDNYRKGLISHPDVNLQELETIEQMNLDLIQLYQKWQTIFMWQDGPLVQAMKDGDLFLVDEISLADDSVLERLNSVLEPERKLVGNLSGALEL